MTRRLACMSSCLKLDEGSASASSEDPSIISDDDHHTALRAPPPAQHHAHAHELQAKFRMNFK